MMAFSDGTKFCTRCKELKLVCDFDKDKYMGDRLCLWCKRCKNTQRVNKWRRDKDARNAKRREDNANRQLPFTATNDLLNRPYIQQLISEHTTG